MQLFTQDQVLVPRKFVFLIDLHNLRKVRHLQKFHSLNQGRFLCQIMLRSIDLALGWTYHLRSCFCLKLWVDINAKGLKLLKRVYWSFVLKLCHSENQSTNLVMLHLPSSNFLLNVFRFNVYLTDRYCSFSFLDSIFKARFTWFTLSVRFKTASYFKSSRNEDQKTIKFLTEFLINS